MQIDPVTSLRTEWVSAALVTNQIPRAADIALQLGTYDARAVNFLPRTIRKLITSSLTSNGVLPVSCERMLRQMKERRYGKDEDMQGGVELDLLIQSADDLKEVEDESVDVVLSLQSVEKMAEAGLDWQESVREAIRVLKPGTGRLLFVERTSTGYLSFLEEFEGEFFEEIGYDDVDLVLVPHVAGVAVKSEDAGLSEEEKEKKRKQVEKDMLAERSIQAFERGSKRRRKKKKVVSEEEEA
jgi:SAM-dependent methyltransferase